MAVAFSEEAERSIQAILERYPERQAALIPVLYLALREFGYLTQESLAWVAKRMDLTEAKVLTTASFYTMLHTKPVGRYHLQVCRNLSCYLRGADDLVACIGRKLGIGAGEMTSDKLFSLEEVECLAACGTAPIVRVNEDYHEAVTDERLEALIDTLAAEGGAR